MSEWPKKGSTLVRGEDYDALATENAALRSRLTEATAAWHDRDTRLLAMEARLAEAEALLREARYSLLHPLERKHKLVEIVGGIDAFLAPPSTNPP